MAKYYALAVATSYWKPNDNYTDKIVGAVENKVQNGDFVVVSEKAISTATGNMVDESTVKPSVNAKFLARFWMRVVWGYCLGVLCHFGQRLLKAFAGVSVGAWQPPQASCPRSRRGFCRRSCSVPRAELTAQIWLIPT